MEIQPLNRIIFNFFFLLVVFLLHPATAKPVPNDCSILLINIDNALDPGV